MLGNDGPLKGPKCKVLYLSNVIPNTSMGVHKLINEIKDGDIY